MHCGKDCIATQRHRHTHWMGSFSRRTARPTLLCSVMCCSGERASKTCVFRVQRGVVFSERVTFMRARVSHHRNNTSALSDTQTHTQTYLLHRVPQAWAAQLVHREHIRSPQLLRLIGVHAVCVRACLLCTSLAGPSPHV